MDDVPVILFQGWQIHHLAIRGKSHAVATALVGFFPEDFVGPQIEAGEELQRAYIKPAGRRVGGHAFDVERFSFLDESARRDASNEAVAAIDVEHEDAVPAPFE